MNSSTQAFIEGYFSLRKEAGKGLPDRMADRVTQWLQAIYKEYPFPYPEEKAVRLQRAGIPVPDKLPKTPLHWWDSLATPTRHNYQRQRSSSLRRPVFTPSPGIPNR